MGRREGRACVRGYIKSINTLESVSFPQKGVEGSEVSPLQRPDRRQRPPPSSVSSGGGVDAHRPPEPGPSLRCAACARGASPCAAEGPRRPRASSRRGPEPDVTQRAVSDPLSLLPGRLGLHEIAFRKGMRISAREGLAKAARGAGCPRAGEASLRAPTPTPAARHRALEKLG